MSSSWQHDLGYAPGNSLSNVRKKYFKLVKRYHPDKAMQRGSVSTASDEAQIRRLTVAWEAAQRHYETHHAPATRAPAFYTSSSIDSSPTPMNWEPSVRASAVPPYRVGLTAQPRGGAWPAPTPKVPGFVPPRSYDRPRSALDPPRSFLRPRQRP